MAKIRMTKGGVFARFDESKRDAAAAKGWTVAPEAAHTDAPADSAGHSEVGEPPAEAKQDAPSALARFGRAHIDGAKALLTGAGVGAAMGKDDDLAGTAAALGAATQQDMDAGNPMVALRRVLGTAAPAFVPGLGIAGEVASRAEQYLADKAAPGARETATLGQQEKVAKSFKDSPMLTGTGLLIGGGLNAAVTGGALANTAVQGGAKALAASGFAPGFVTGFEGKDDGNLQERVASGLGAGAVGALGSVAAPMVLRAAGGGLEKLGNMRIGATVPKAPGTGPGARVLRGIKNLAADPDAVLAAAPQWSGGPALKTARDVWKRGAPPTSAPGMAGDASLADDLTQGFNPGGKTLNASGVIEEAAGASDDAALAALKAKMAAEDAPLVLRKRKPDAPRKLQGPPDTFRGAAEATPEEIAASMARMQSSRVMPDVEPGRMPLLPPDLLEAQLARTGGDREKALAAAHGQLSKEFKRTDPELARGRQRSAVNFDDASPGPAPIATPKGRNRSAAPFQGEDWAPREAAAPAAIVDDVAAPVVAADEGAAFRAAYALSDAAERAGTKASISGTSGDHIAAAKAHEAAAAARGPGGAGQKHLRAAAEHRAQASTAPSSKAKGFDMAGRPTLRKKATR